MGKGGRMRRVQEGEGEMQKSDFPLLEINVLDLVCMHACVL